MKKRRSYGLLAAVLAGLLLVAACGKKAPPQPPVDTSAYEQVRCDHRATA